MPVIQNFQAFMDGGGLVCPAGKSKIEWAVADEPGLFAESRASATAVPTWYLRLKKTGANTNVYKRLGTVKEISLAQARKLVKQIRAEHAVMVKSAGAAAATQKTEMTLERFFQDLYLPHAKIHKRSWNKDESLWRCRLSKAFGHLHLPDVKRLPVMTFHNEILASGLSAAQSRHHVVLMARLLSLAVAWELLEKNVLKGVELAPLENFRDTFLSEEETSRLVQVLTTDSNKLVCAILLTLLNTGARKMEVMKAEWSHIELENRLWTVPSALCKNKKSKTMVLGDSTVKILMALESRGKSKYVFPNPETGKPMTTISRVWYRLRKQAGINPNMRIHDTRSSLAQRLLANNVSLEVVARTLGNNPSMAYARYARFSTKTMLDAANAGAVPMPQFEGSKVNAANAGSVIVPRAVPQESKPMVAVAVTDIAKQEAANDLSAAAPTVETQEAKLPVPVRVAVVPEPITTVSMIVPTVVPQEERPRADVRLAAVPEPDTVVSLIGPIVVSQEERPRVVVRVAVVPEPITTVSMIVPTVEAQEPKAA